MVRFKAYLLGDLELIDGLQDSQALSYGCNTNFFQGICIHYAEHVSRDAMFCVCLSTSAMPFANTAGQDCARTMDLILILWESQRRQPVVHVAFIPVQDI
jgi:hypothetical protein